MRGRPTPTNCRIPPSRMPDTDTSCVTVTPPRVVVVPAHWGMAPLRQRGKFREREGEGGPHIPRVSAWPLSRSWRVMPPWQMALGRKSELAGVECAAAALVYGVQCSDPWLADTGAEPKREEWRHAARGQARGERNANLWDLEANYSCGVASLLSLHVAAAPVPLPFRRTTFPPPSVTHLATRARRWMLDWDWDWQVAERNDGEGEAERADRRLPLPSSLPHPFYLSYLGLYR